MNNKEMMIDAVMSVLDNDSIIEIIKNTWDNPQCIDYHDIGFGILRERGGELYEELVRDTVKRTCSKYKPCPFCGEQPELRVYETRNGDVYLVCCMNFECPVNAQTNEMDTREEAIAIWNHRAV